MYLFISAIREYSTIQTNKEHIFGDVLRFHTLKKLLHYIKEVARILCIVLWGNKS